MASTGRREPAAPPGPWSRRRAIRAVAGAVLTGAWNAVPTSAAAAPPPPGGVLEPLSPEFSSAVADPNDPAARVRTVHSGGRWCEGPVWSPSDAGLVFSDVRADRLLCLPGGSGPASVLRDPSNNSNGNALDREGRLLSCEHRGRRVVRREADGRLTVLADSFGGRRLNSPNDLAMAADGSLWFTDPVFGITQPDEGLQAEPEQSARHVFCLLPDGRLQVACDSFDQPNGIAFSPDFRTLYVSEAGAARDPDGGGREIRAFDRDAGSRLRRERLFARLDTGVPDGLRTDAAGRVYAATGDGVRVWSPDGAPLGLIRTAAACGNLAFGGRDGRTLFICSGPRIHALAVRTRGAAWA